MLIRLVCTSCQVSSRQATEFSPARRPIVSPGHVDQPCARAAKAARWLGWNSCRPTTLMACCASTEITPFTRWVPPAIPGFAPPLLVWVLPRTLKVAIVKSATGGSSLGLGRGTAGLASTGFVLSNGAALPVKIEAGLEERPAGRLTDT